jgi:hypothetical protein
MQDALNFYDSAAGAGKPVSVRVPAFIDAFAMRAAPLASSQATRAFLERLVNGDLRMRLLHGVMASVMISEPNAKISEALQRRITQLWNRHPSCDASQLIRILDAVFL